MAAITQKKGTEITKGNNRYKVTSSNIGGPTVKFIGLVKPEVKKVTIPATITVKKVKYRVTEISASSVTGNANIAGLVINRNVNKISAKAFQGCTKLKTIRIKTKSIKKMGSKAFGEIHQKAKFYTYYSKISSYTSMLKKAGVKKPNVRRL